jgi:hypothetical protein
MSTLVLLAIAALAVWVGWLYLRPFGPCPKCKGTGHIKRGARRRPVCPRCKGRRRVQRCGSRTVIVSPARSATVAGPPPGTSRRTGHEGNLADNR